ncbi:Transglut_core domain-containing protein [Cephalotus follicularis]|uniref:Transglut_core domain-containing protein n=1 Tax=Cephalotus follicularis TaxID=3775 RepID=A0A1Q3DE85_CEPFO|nr:Transglut_core domain-containing protein [Cephalotus follicularis]
MVARKFLLRHRDSTFDVDYDTDHGFEVLKYQLFSLTSVPPDDQEIFGGDDDRLLSDDSDLISISEKLRLVSINGGESTGGTDASVSLDLMKSDEDLARMLQAEEDALMLQQFVAGEDSMPLEQRLRPCITQVLMYEDPVRQEAARKTVPVEELEEKALVSLAKEGNFKPSKTEQDHAFLLQLLFWFKQSFRWVDAPPCDGCGNDTLIQGMGVSLPSEIQYGATRVELYRCTCCSRITRFPRYNDPLKLLETRRGRCGEWANCFTLYCQAFGYESRWILDFTDHVWTECFSQLLGRWMHLDPCEAVYDKPMLYENGWEKKLNYVFAIARDGVYDVTKRYTRKWHEVLSRRNDSTEATLSDILSTMTRDCRKSFTSGVLSVLEDRDRNEREELERDLHNTPDSSVSLPGRQSGDKEWRISRSEIGSNSNCSLSSSSCPARVCVDEHVTRIYNAFSPVVSQFVKRSLSKSKAVEVLKFIKEMLVDLRNSPYKTRRAFLNPVLADAQKITHLLLPSFGDLLEALSLKSESSSGGRVDISLAGDPVKTSLALPVVLDALDDMIQDLNKLDDFGNDSLSLPLLKLNRIHSGTVLASGEELPFGIATSAFDGTKMSKWEEPNGARGSSIVYKLSDGQMHELVAYELMSANDAPERDPMDWVVEGSNDGGSRWRDLDRQTSQKFENRFQRKTYRLTPLGFPANAFRFRFLTVRDVESNSRLQLGSIDLYASK